MRVEKYGVNSFLREAFPRPIRVRFYDYEKTA